MVLLTVTPRILERLSELPEASELAVGSSISHEQLVELVKALYGSGQDGTLDELLRGTDLYFPPPPPKPAKTPEYIALMARLRREQEELEYRTMLDKSSTTGSDLLLSNVDGKIKLESEEQMMREINSQVSIIFNVLFSVLACAGGVWYVARYWPVGYRLSLSLLAGLVVGVAEVVVFNGYLRKVEESKAKERAKKEVKTVLRTWKTNDKSHEDDAVTVLEEKSKHEVVRRRKGKK